MSSPMAGVAVVNAVVFGVYGNVQRNLSDPESLQSYFLAGATAGLAQSVIASPMEMVKTRLQIQKTAQYKSPIDCLIKIARRDGFKGVFKGLNITGFREFFGYGVYFSSYEALTRRSPDEYPITTFHMLLAGGFSGCASWMVTYPLDVIKSRLQADGMSGVVKYSGVFDCLRKSVAEEGWLCLTRGLTPTLIRAFPTNAVTFTVVTWIFRMANVGTKEDELTISDVLEVIPNQSLQLKEYNVIESTSEAPVWSIRGTDCNSILIRIDETETDDEEELEEDIDVELLDSLEAVEDIELISDVAVTIR